MDADTRAIQLKELEILKQVAAICQRHGLRYFGDGGTCLGAVRHRGFIPWDDDIDVGMPRKDFDRFRQIAPKELPEYLALQDFTDTPHMNHLFMKVHDTRTTFIPAGLRNYPDAQTGIYVDIFAYDGYPGKGLRRRWWRLRTGVLLRLNWLLRVYDRKETAYDRFRGGIAKVLRKVLPYNWASVHMERFLRKYDADREPEITLAYMGFRYCFPRKCFDEAKLLPFEDIQLPVPADYDTYLKIHYGDYMTLPPESERTAIHPTAYFSLERSYKERWWEKAPDKKEK